MKAIRERLGLALACLAALGSLILLAPTAAQAQSFELRAAFPDKPAHSEPSPPVSKGYSFRGPGIVVIRHWYSPHLPVNNTYNTGGVFGAGKSPDNPFGRILCFKHYQDGRRVMGNDVVYGKDLLVVWVVELGNTTVTNAVEVHPSVKWSLGGQMDYQNRWIVRVQMEVHPPGTDAESLCGFVKNPEEKTGKPEDDTPPGKESIAGSSWIVNSQPVPWAFSAGGRVEAKGLWTGTWTETPSGIQVTITHQGVSDTFIVKVAADGRTFTAYKNGQVYRTGVRR